MVAVDCAFEIVGRQRLPRLLPVSGNIASGGPAPNRRRESQRTQYPGAPRPADPPFFSRHRGGGRIEQPDQPASRTCGISIGGQRPRTANLTITVTLSARHRILDRRRVWLVQNRVPRPTRSPQLPYEVAAQRAPSSTRKKTVPPRHPDGGFHAVPERPASTPQPPCPLYQQLHAPPLLQVARRGLLRGVRIGEHPRWCRPPARDYSLRLWLETPTGSRPWALTSAEVVAAIRRTKPQIHRRGKISPNRRCPTAPFFPQPNLTFIGPP